MVIPGIMEILASCRMASRGETMRANGSGEEWYKTEGMGVPAVVKWRSYKTEEI